MTNEHIDVLAVIDANLHYQQDNDMHRDLREARAAVAELIEAAKQAKRALRSSYSEQHAAETRLRAALARVQGEGA
jgi:histidinol phosphatase-like PHP family hydrolase